VLCSYRFHFLVTGISDVAAKKSTIFSEYRELLATAAALQVSFFYPFISHVVDGLQAVNREDTDWSIEQLVFFISETKEERNNNT
jgi:hypothetical protein